MTRKKVSGASDYIIPLAIVGVVGLGLYYVWQQLFGGSAGPASALNKAINDAAASSPLSTQVSTAATATDLDAWYNAQQNATNPFLPTLFDTSNGCAVLADNVAQDLWADLYTASNATAFFKPTPDMSGILAEWQKYVQNQCDVSMIASNCQQQMGDTLWNFMVKYFGNDQTGSSGQTNQAMLYNLVLWVASLPQTT